MRYYWLDIVLLMMLTSSWQNGIASNLISLTWKGLVRKLEVQ